VPSCRFILHARPSPLPRR